MTRVLTFFRKVFEIQCKQRQQCFNEQNSHRLLRRSFHSYQSCESNERKLTSQEVATALRPFFFVVHPDRFWKYPKERDTNEDSLKQLNAYIENVVEMRETTDQRITFFIREDISNEENSLNDVNNNNNETNVKLKQININLFRRENVNKIVHKILSESRLSTDYLKKIGKQPKVTKNYNQNNTKTGFDFKNDNQKTGFKSKHPNEFWFNSKNSAETDPEFQEFVDFIEKKRIEKNLKEWLRENTELAAIRLRTSQPIREDLSQLNDQLKREINLKEIIWKDCGWGVSHIRGALKSLNTLRQQHSQDFDALNGRTLVFGRQSGVTFDGHVILNIEDVRHNWLEMIRNIDSFDSDLRNLPFFESQLSGALRGIQIDHRKFRPAVLVKNYSKQLEKLTSALVEHIAINGFPRNWPPALDNFQLVVECEAGPLMLSPTGQFIVPASCPAFLLFDFMSENMFKSRLLRDMYLNFKSKEVKAIDECLTALGIKSIEKDDNVTPDLMIQCCHNLILNKESIIPFLRDSRLRVSHYYSVLLDGEICIPWNFRV